MPSIAIVILNYNGKQLLSDLLPTVLAHSTTAEVIVADNASTDGSIALLKQDFPTVRRIELNKNYGFAEGYNLALKQLQTDYYVLLNSDVAVTENWLQPLVAYMEQNPQTAACQPKLKNFNHRDYFEYAGACGGFIDQYVPFEVVLDTVEKDNAYDEIAVFLGRLFFCTAEFGKLEV